MYFALLNLYEIITLYLMIVSIFILFSHDYFVEFMNLIENILNYDVNDLISFLYKIILI